MALKQNNTGTWIWDFRPNGYKGKRVRKLLPENIKTEEQATLFIKEMSEEFKFSKSSIASINIQNWSKVSDRSQIETLFHAFYNHSKSCYSNQQYQEIIRAGNVLLKYLINNTISLRECLNPSPNLLIEFVNQRKKLVTAKYLNRELLCYKRIHDYWVFQGLSIPNDFEFSQFYIKDKEQKVQFSEKFYELLIEKFPKEFLNEELKTLKKTPVLEGLIPDSIFIEDDGTYVVVEIQKELLDRQHAYKILEYRDKLEIKLKKASITAKIRMIAVVIGEQCSPERRIYLNKYGISLKFIPIKKIEEIILKLLGNK